MLLTNSTDMQKGTRKRTIGRLTSLGPTSTKIIGIALVAMLALFYIAQNTQKAARNYEIQNLEDQKKILENSKDELTVEAMRLKSLQQIKDKANELKMEPE